MSTARYLSKHTFLGVLPSFFARKATAQVKELYISSAILDFAVALILFFEPIYLYQQGVGLKGIMSFYLVVYFFYFFLMPLGGKFVKRYGFEHAMFLGSPLLIVYYLFLILVGQSSFFLIPAALFYALHKTFYWPGYHADFVHYGINIEQGREVSNRIVLMTLVFVLGPLVGGFVIQFFSFTVLFVIVSLLIMLSNVPLLLTPEVFEPSRFSYLGTYRRLFKKENRVRFISYLGFGEELILLTLWPIFMIILLGSALSTGTIIALSTLTTSFIVLYVGKLTDKIKKGPLLRFTTIIYALSWVLHLLIRNALGVFVVGTISQVGKNALSVPQIAITYQNARKRGVVKDVIFFEMALVVGKILAILFVLLILFFASKELQWQLIFLLASLFTVLYSVLNEVK